MKKKFIVMLFYSSTLLPSQHTNQYAEKKFCSSMILKKRFSSRLVSDKRVALIRAVSKDNEVAVQRLLKGGVSPNVQSGPYSLLHFAIKVNATKSIKLLLGYGVDVNFRNDTLCSPLNASLIRGNIEATRALLKNKDIIYLSDEKNRNPVHCAVWGKNIEGLRLLIEHYPKNRLIFLLNQKNAAGKTPLHDAAANGLSDIAAVLIHHGAEVNSLCTFKKRTPLLDCLRSHKKCLIHAQTQEEYEKKFKERLSTEQVISFCKELKKSPVSLDLSIKDVYQIDARDAINKINFDTDDEKKQLEKIIFCSDCQ